MNIEVGKGRPFNILTDSVENVDPSQTVYPIRGNYVGWQCGVLGSIGYEGKANIGADGKVFYNPNGNCTSSENRNASGHCWKDTFGDWHCKMWGSGATPMWVHAPTAN